MRFRVHEASLCAVLVILLTASSESKRVYNLQSNEEPTTKQAVDCGGLHGHQDCDIDLNSPTSATQSFTDESGLLGPTKPDEAIVDFTTEGHVGSRAKKYKSKKKNSCHHKHRRHRTNFVRQKSRTTTAPSLSSDGLSLSAVTEAPNDLIPTDDEVFGSPNLTDVTNPTLPVDVTTSATIDVETESPVIKNKKHRHRRPYKRRYHSRCHNKHSKSKPKKAKSTTVFPELLSPRSNLGVSEEYTDGEHESLEHREDNQPKLTQNMKSSTDSIKLR